MAMTAKVTVRDEDRQIVVVLEEAEGSTDVASMLGSSRPPAAPSFQFLLNKIVNRFPDDRKHIVVEAPSVSAKIAERKAQAQAQPQRDHRSHGGRGHGAPKQLAELPPDIDPELAALARLLAERANAIGKVITVHPMSAPDRRAVHQTIMTVANAETVSEGEGIYRRMHIIPAVLRRGGASEGHGAGETAEGGPGRRRRRRRRRRGRGDDRGPAPQDNATASDGDQGDGDDDGDEIPAAAGSPPDTGTPA
jgi:hypothetical protein